MVRNNVISALLDEIKGLPLTNIWPAISYHKQGEKEIYHTCYCKAAQVLFASNLDVPSIDHG